MASTSSLPTLSSSAPIQKIVKKKFKSEVLLGSPSTGCQGVGICKVMFKKVAEKVSCPVTTAWISLSEERKIRISFWKSTMSEREMKRHFGWMLFQVFEPYKLTKQMQKALGTERDMISPGIYTVWETPQFLIVDF